MNTRGLVATFAIMAVILSSAAFGLGTFIAGNSTGSTIYGTKTDTTTEFVTQNGAVSTEISTENFPVTLTEPGSNFTTTIISSTTLMTAETATSNALSVSTFTTEGMTTVTYSKTVTQKAQTTTETVISDSTISTVLIWNIPETIPANGFGVEGIPDTFDYHDTWTSNSTLEVYYMSIFQFVQFDNCGISCVTGVFYFVTGTSASDTFTKAECNAGWVAVYTQPQGVTPANVLITPNVTATYNPIC